jgi:metallo-beta-lactamase family protein
MKLQFLGASQEVTGSCYLLENRQRHALLVDCGLFQGERLTEKKNHKDFDFDIKGLDAVLITHAHLDHIGRAPKLIKGGYQRKIYSTPPTFDFARLILEDSYQIMKSERYHFGLPLLFSRPEIIRTLSLWEKIGYRKEFSPAPGFNVAFRNAGHILGSACIEIEAEGQKIIFSGDLGNSTVPLIKKLAPLQGADILIIESTYGNIIHEDRAKRETELKRTVNQALEKGGVVMIPSFALERTQELLYLFNSLIETGQIPKVPVFLDSPLAIRMIGVFRTYLKGYFNQRSLKILTWDEDIFSFPGLKLCQTAEESKLINQIPSPKIIIAGHGMMMGGRILYHAKRYLADPASTLIFIGYQVKSSLGRKILDGHKRVQIHDQRVPVRASVKAIGAYSAHADQRQLVSWVNKMKQKPKQIFITHGELERSKGLKNRLEQELKSKIYIPKEGEMVDI